MKTGSTTLASRQDGHDQAKVQILMRTDSTGSAQFGNQRRSRSYLRRRRRYMGCGQWGEETIVDFAEAGEAGDHRVFDFQKISIYNTPGVRTLPKCLQFGRRPSTGYAYSHGCEPCGQCALYSGEKESLREEAMCGSKDIPPSKVGSYDV